MKNPIPSSYPGFNLLLPLGVALILSILILVSPAISVIFIGIILVIFFAFYKFDQLFFIAVALIPMENFVIIHLFNLLNIKLLHILWLLLVIVYFIKLSFSKNKQYFDRTIMFPLIVFNILELLSIFVSNIPRVSIRESVQFAFYSVIFYVIVQQMRKREHIIKTAKYLLLSSSIFIVFGLIQGVNGESPIPNIHIKANNGVRILMEKGVLKEIQTESEEIDISRGSSFFFTSVATGSFLNQVILLLLPLLFRKNITNKKKMPLLLLLLGGTILWIATYSRAAWVILIFCIGISILRRKRPKEILGMAAMFFVLLFIGASTPGIRSRFIDIFSLTQGSNVSHFILWKEAAINIANNPFLGTGAGTLSAPLRSSGGRDGASSIKSKDYAGRWVHNMLLQVMAEIGIIGGLALLSFFLAILYKQWLAIKQKESSLYYDIMEGLIFGMFSCLLINLTLNVFYKLIFWVSLGVSFAAARIFLTGNNEQYVISPNNSGIL